MKVKPNKPTGAVALSCPHPSVELFVHTGDDTTRPTSSQKLLHPYHHRQYSPLCVHSRYNPHRDITLEGELSIPHP